MPENNIIEDRVLETPKDFEFEVLLWSDRVNPTTPIILTTSTIAFEIYENIDMPFLTGKIAIADTNDLESVYEFKGTERFIISVKLPGSEGWILKTFSIFEVSNKVSTNDNSSVLTFNIIEQHGYLDRVLQISKMYDGKPETIIQKIVKDNFNKDVINKSLESFQPRQRFLIPYLNPFNATRKVLENLSTEAGLPYYLYSTFNNSSLILKDLQTMISDKAFSDNPFMYSQAFTQSSEDIDPIFKMYNIEHIEEENNSDSLMLAQLGVYGAGFSTFNIQTGKSDYLHFNLLHHYERLAYENVLPLEQRKIRLDTKVIPDPESEEKLPLDTYDSRNFFRLSAQTYAYDKGVYTFGHTEPNAANYAVKLTTNAFKQMMSFNEIKVRVPGLAFLLNGGITVGDSILVDIPPNKAPENDETRSVKKSGKFIITNRCHSFNMLDNTSVVDMTISRIAELN